MSKSSPKSEFNQEKRKLLYWISQWDQDLNHVQNIQLDVSDLAILFQIMGYKLEFFDKIKDLQDNKQSTSTKNETFLSQLELTCKKSGTRLRFSKETTTCKCPTESEVDKGQFWSVTGCVPSSSSHNSVNSSTSSLIPTISQGKVEIISYLMSKIFSIIDQTDSTEQKESVPNLSQNSLLTRHGSLDTLKSKEGSGIFKEKLKREHSWETDMKSSPSTQTSSSVPDLTRTLSRISLDSNTKNVLANNLCEIQKLTKEALELVGGKRILQRKRISDVKPTEGPSVSELKQNCLGTPRKRLTPKRLLSSGGRTGIPTPTLSQIRPTTSKFAVTTHTNQQVIFKSKLGAASKLRSAIGLANSNKGGDQPGTSGLAKYKSSKK